MAAKVARWRKRLWSGIAALGLAVPSAAYPYSLQQLLRMPLERLLQLEISPRRVSQSNGAAVLAAAPAPHDRGRHAA